VAPKTGRRAALFWLDRPIDALSQGGSSNEDGGDHHVTQGPAQVTSVFEQHLPLEGGNEGGRPEDQTANEHQ
jgi:hypothetical protein